MCPSKAKSAFQHEKTSCSPELLRNCLHSEPDSEASQPGKRMDLPSRPRSPHKMCWVAPLGKGGTGGRAPGSEIRSGLSCQPHGDEAQSPRQCHLPPNIVTGGLLCHGAGHGHIPGRALLRPRLRPHVLAPRTRVWTISSGPSLLRQCSATSHAARPVHHGTPPVPRTRRGSPRVQA